MKSVDLNPAEFWRIGQEGSSLPVIAVRSCQSHDLLQDPQFGMVTASSGMPM